MSISRKLLVLVLSLAACMVAQAEERWQEGTHYFKIKNPLPTSTPGKVEVLDVFSYACPACNAFEPTWNRIRKSLPPQAAVAYLPASFNPQEDWPVFQRAFLAAQALGIAEKTHDSVYDAVWKTGQLAVVEPDRRRVLPAERQPTIQTLAKFYTQFGILEDKFLAQANSFSMDSLMRKCDQTVRNYNVDSTPTIIINGKYRLTPHAAGGLDETVDLVHYLVEREIHGG